MEARRPSPAVLLTLLAAAAAHALEARWTPASDGGPARFSKSFRDAAGIDDSKWIDGEEDGGWPSLFPTTPGGWALAAVAGVAIFMMLGQQQLPPRGGDRVGGDNTARGPAGEAARAAFLKRYGGE